MYTINKNKKHIINKITNIIIQAKGTSNTIETKLTVDIMQMRCKVMIAVKEVSSNKCRRTYSKPLKSDESTVIEFGKFVLKLIKM